MGRRSPLTGLTTWRPRKTPVFSRSASPRSSLRLGQHVVDVLVDRLLLLGARDEPEDVGVLGRHDEERRAEERVRPRGEDRVVDPQLLVAEGDLRALGAPDPVALHRLDVRGPLDRVEVVEQAVGVVGDAEEPLLELADLDEVAAALAAPVDDLLVGEDGLVVGAPLDGGLAAIGQAALEELEEDPLRPAVVARLVGPELARPVDRDPPLAELPLEGGDRRVRRLARVLAGADRVVLGRQAEGVVAHRMQHAHARGGGGSGRPRRRPSSSSGARRAARRWGRAASRARRPPRARRARWTPPRCARRSRRAASAARSHSGHSGRTRPCRGA